MLLVCVEGWEVSLVVQLTVFVSVTALKLVLDCDVVVGFGTLKEMGLVLVCLASGFGVGGTGWCD